MHGTEYNSIHVLRVSAHQPYSVVSCFCLVFVQVHLRATRINNRFRGQACHKLGAHVRRGSATVREPTPRPWALCQSPPKSKCLVCPIVLHECCVPRSHVFVHVPVSVATTRSHQHLQLTILLPPTDPPASTRGESLDKDLQNAATLPELGARCPPSPTTATSRSSAAERGELGSA